MPTLRLVSTLAVLGLWSSVTHAQSYLSPQPPPYAIDERFRLEVDLLYGSYDTRLRMDTQNPAGPPTPGTPISAEQDLGLAETELLGQVELTLLPGDHHLVRLNTLSMRRSGSAILTRNVVWDGVTYNVGDRVDSYMNLDMVGLTYGYLPLRNDRYELGVSFGINIMSVSANAEVRSEELREPRSAAGPLPVFGVEGRYEFTRRWSADARWQYLSLGWAEALGADINDVDATVSDARIAVRWRFNPHLVVGLGYRWFSIDVLAPNSDPAGMVNIGLTGPMLFAQASL